MKTWNMTTTAIKNEGLKWFISIGITLILFLVTLGINKIDKMSNKLDSIVVTTTINTGKINSHERESIEWKDRIKMLEGTQWISISREEVMDALEKQKGWVELYYQRK